MATAEFNLMLWGEVFQGLRRTLTAPLPIAIVGEAEGTELLLPITPIPIPGEGAVPPPFAAVEVLPLPTVVVEVALPLHGDAADAEVGPFPYPLPPNRLVPVLALHPLVAKIP